MKRKVKPLSWLVCTAMMFLALFTAQGVQVLQPTGTLDRPQYITVQLNTHERISRVDIYRGMPFDGWQTLVVQVDIPVDLQDDTVQLDVNTQPLYNVLTCGEYLFKISTVEGGIYLSDNFILYTDLVQIRVVEDDLIFTTNNPVTLYWASFGQPWHTNFNVCVYDKNGIGCATRPDYDPGHGRPVSATSVAWQVPSNAPVGQYTYIVSQPERRSNFDFGGFAFDRRGTLAPTMRLRKTAANTYQMSAFVEIPGEPRIQNPPRLFFYEYSFDLAVWGKLNQYPSPLGDYKLTAAPWIDVVFLRARESLTYDGP